MFRNTLFALFAVAVAFSAALGAPTVALAADALNFPALTPDAIAQLVGIGALGFTVQALKEKRGSILTAMRGMVDKLAEEDRDFTDEEQADYAAKEKEVEKLAATIAARQKLEAMEAAADAPDDSVALRAALASAPGANAPGPRKSFENVAEFLSAAAFNPGDERLANLYHERRGDMEMGTGTAGGFAVPEQFRSDIMSVNPQQSIVRPRATVIPAGSPPDSAITIPAMDQTGATPDNVYGGVRVDWTEEGGTKTKSDAKLRQIKLQPHEVSGYITLTDKLLRNWQASGSFVEGQLRGAVSAAEDHAFLNANGVGKPLGLRMAGAAYKVNREQASKILIADIDAMMARILMRGGSPLWIGSQSILPQLQGLVDGEGRRLWSPNAAAGYPGTLAGYPVMYNERSPLLGGAGDLILADLSYYLIKDGSGPFVEAGKATGDFENNRTSIKITWNTDGQPWLTAPFKQEGGYEVSPFLVLDLPSGG
ncbi:phage major capsid protein [Flagellatimonas centrodinii]|uniref:phage major capsid protein n=1 Tax=Flagellatimonas centrodinii TaxID=2806210 RepID=UPI001FEE4AC7|nr:phage major capsid protein [Flagellatimonas centrodinii]ULQ45864.1 phage major capsid protein [Flagellatimonas centrodinii]